ncbi:MAG: hypothetical protein FWC03_00480 [Treponema sp.]|nr:hypothetical protein [Treponema sp.]
MNRYYNFFLPILLCFIFYPVYSQEENNYTDNNQHSEKSVKSDSVYIINSFIFNIEGFTRPNALINHAKFIKGEEITGFINLEKYISDKTQILINQRVLDSASIEYITFPPQEDGKIPVELIINTKDTWNIVAIPRPRYSSNSGFDITLKARDYNFLGTMSPLRLDLGYMYDENKEHFIMFMLDSDIPLRIFNLNWNLNFDNFFDYRPDMEQLFYYKNVTGLSVELPVKSTTVTLGFNESFIINEENNDDDKIPFGNFQDGFYISSSPFISWRIPTGIEAGLWGELVYTAGVSALFNHELPQWPLDEIRKGPFLSFSHNLGFNRIDWIGNFLRGYDVSVSNSFSYNFYNYRNDIEPWDSHLNVTGIAHLVFDDIFGISSRFMYRHWFFTEKGASGAGDVMRGILDRDVSAEFMISANFDLPVSILKFRLSEWLNNDKYRFFNFDLHLVPILDIAFYRSPENEALYSGADFTYKNMLVSGGIEAIIFPEFFRSLFLRISLGFNLSAFITNSRYELFIGTDLHY